MDGPSHRAVQEGMLSCRFFRAALPICLFASLLPAQQNRISAPVDRRNSVVIRGSVPLQARPQFDQGAVAGDFTLGNLTLVLRPSAAQQADLDQLLTEQQDPTSPNYHKWLTPEAYADRFGTSAADMEKIAGWLRDEGFVVRYTARGRDFLSFSGTASQVQSAFNTRVHRYQVGGVSHFANAVDLSLPASIAPMAAGVMGFHDFHPRAPHKQALPHYTDSPGNYALLPDDYATIYDLASLYQAGFSGNGQSIVIVGQSDIDPSDIATFRSAFGLTPVNIQMMPTGTYPGFTGDEVEADLDLEWSGAVAREANLIYVYSEDADYSAYYAIDNNFAPIISESFGLCEYQVASNHMGLYNYQVEAKKGNALGITWLASSGDSGAAGCDYDSEFASNGFGVILPSSVPQVTAVGGTEFNEGSGSYWSANNNPNGGSAISYIPEAAWNDTAVYGGLAASGGGMSSVYTKPAWQTGAGVPSDGARDVPDVSLDASNDHDPYLIISGGAAYGIGGTSASAPAFAGIVAVLNQYLVQNQVQGSSGVGNINPKLYSMAGSTTTVFHPVTTGSNIVPCVAATLDCTNGQFGYKTGPGYNMVTGLGSVDAYQFVTAWAGIPVANTTTSLTSSPTMIPANGSSVLTATVTATSGSRTPSGTVTFTLDGNGLGTAVLSGTGLTATASITVYGDQVLAANNTVTATYGGSPIFNGSSANATLTLGAPVTSAVTVSVNPNPVVQQTANAAGATFFFTIQLQETAGVATTVNGFTFDGISFAGSIGSLFGSTKLPAHGTLTAKVSAGNIPAPSTGVLVFTGRDASGAVWSQQITVPFLPAQ
jgi:subtilase family serine protease